MLSIILMSCSVSYFVDLALLPPAQSAVGNLIVFISVTQYSSNFFFCQTSSILGYCLLPMVLLAFFSAFLATTGHVMFGLTVVAVAWCSWRCSEMMVLAMDVQHERCVSECVSMRVCVCVCVCVSSEIMVLAMDVQYERCVSESLSMCLYD